MCSQSVCFSRSRQRLHSTNEPSAPPFATPQPSRCRFLSPAAGNFVTSLCYYFLTFCSFNLFVITKFAVSHLICCFAAAQPQAVCLSCAWCKVVVFLSALCNDCMCPCLSQLTAVTNQNHLLWKIFATLCWSIRQTTLNAAFELDFFFKKKKEPIPLSSNIFIFHCTCEFLQSGR